MAYIPSECSIQEYENQIYSGESKHRLYIKHGSTVIGTNGDENASPFASKLTWTRRILDNGKNSFSLDNFVSQEIELELHDYIIYNLDEEIEIKIGTYIPSIDDYVYVPLGIYKIQDNPTNDKDKTTYKLRDRSVNFDFNYNAKDLIESNSGKATKGQILQDICQKANVKFVGNENFIGYNDPIGIYDNTISARVYVSYIAEQTGCIATIDRNGDLIFVQISEDLDKKELPYNLLESYTVGERYQIGKIEYESGVIKYEQSPYTNIEGESIYVDNAAENSFIELTIDGKSEQEIGTSNNLMKYDQTEFPENLTDELVASVNEDGSIQVVGTKTDTNWVAIQLSPLDVFIKGGKEYYTKDFYIQGYGVATNKFYSSIESRENRPYLAPEDIKISTVILHVNEAREYNDTYYPYIGEVPFEEPFTLFYDKPSPDCPSEIESVGYTNLFSSEMELGWIDMGTGNLSSNTNGIRTKDFIRVIPENKYYIANDKNYVLILYYYDENETFISSEVTETGSFTIPTNAYFFKTASNCGSGENDLSAKYILSKKPITFDYIPYGKYGIDVKITNGTDTNTISIPLNEPLRSLPNGVKDVVYIRNNKLYVDRYVGSVILNGSESWTQRTGGVNSYYVNLDNCKGIWLTKLSHCNYFSYDTEGAYNGTNGYGIDGNGRLMIGINNITTVEEFKTWLSTHNTQVDYELATPTTEEIGDINFQFVEGENIITNNCDALMNLKYFAIEEGKATLYLSSSNPYINSQYTLEQIFPKVKDFYLDSLEVSRILGNPTIDVYDIITIEHTNEDRKTISYRTLAQGVLTFSGTMTQNFETIIEYSESQSNVSINGEPTFKKMIKTQVDNIEATLTTTIEKVEETEKGLISFENRFTQSIEGLENILSSAGGNNYVRDSMGVLNDGSWTNIDTILDTFTRTYAVGQSAIMLNKTTPSENEEDGRPIKQKINCKNGTYTLSFDYYRLIPLSVCKIIINENEYELTNYDELTKFKETFSVLTNEVNIEFVSDTNNSCYILNLILNDGVDALNWSQNTNETITDTVKIGKGIQVESNIANTLWRADADGSRVFNKTTGAIVREDTARGTITNELESKGTSKINGLLVLKTNNQIWLSGV